MAAVETVFVDESLRLLQGMQARGLIADTVKLNPNGVEIINLRTWTPFPENPKGFHNDLLDGHGEPA